MSSENAAPQPPDEIPAGQHTPVDHTTVPVGNPAPREKTGPDTDWLTDPNGPPKLAAETPLPSPESEAPTEFVSAAEVNRTISESPPTPAIPSEEQQPAPALEAIPEPAPVVESAPVPDPVPFSSSETLAEHSPDPPIEAAAPKLEDPTHAGPPVVAELPPIEPKLEPEEPTPSQLLPLLGQEEPPIAEPIDVPTVDFPPAAELSDSAQANSGPDSEDALSSPVVSTVAGSGWFDYSFIKSAESVSASDADAKAAVDEDVLSAESLPDVQETPAYDTTGGASDVFSDLAAATPVPPEAPSPAPLDAVVEVPRSSTGDESSDSLFSHLAVASTLPIQPPAGEPMGSGTDLGTLPDDLFEEPKPAVAASAPAPIEDDDLTLLGEPLDEAIPLASLASGSDLLSMGDGVPTAMPASGTDLFSADPDEIPMAMAAPSEIIVEKPAIPPIPAYNPDDVPDAIPEPTSSVIPSGKTGPKPIPNENLDDLFSTLTTDPVPISRKTTDDIGMATPIDAALEFDELPADPAAGGSNLFSDGPSFSPENTSGVNLLRPDSAGNPQQRFPGAHESIFGDESNEPIGGTSSIFTDDPVPARRSGDVDQIPLMHSTDHGFGSGSGPEPSALERDVLGADPRDLGFDELLAGPVSAEPGHISFNVPPKGQDGFDEAEQSSGEVNWSKPPKGSSSNNLPSAPDQVEDDIPELPDLDDPLGTPGQNESEFDMMMLGSSPKPPMMPEDPASKDMIEPLASLSNPNLSRLPDVDPDAKTDALRAGSAWEVTMSNQSQSGQGSSVMPGSVKPVAPSQSGWLSPSMASPASGWLSSPGVGPTSGLFPPPLTPPPSVSNDLDDVRLDATPEPNEPKTAPAGKLKPVSDITDVEPSRGSIGGWVAGTLVGVLIGGGGVAAAFFGGILQVDNGKSLVVKDPGPGGPGIPKGPIGPAATPTVAQAKTLLANGDPKSALPGFDAAGDNASVDIRAARGQARWMARVHELTNDGKAPIAGDAELKKAESDLRKAYSAAGGSDQEKEAGILAARNLGLLRELTGDLAGAKRVYEEAASKFPEAKPIFDAALNRLKLMTPAPNADGIRESRRIPTDADRLTGAIVLTMLMLQADTPAAKTPEEPGFLFWQAVNEAAAGEYATAIKTLAEARKLHDKKRLSVVGKGVNPVSDPLEQIFLRTCDDLTAYWTLKRDIYEHKTLRPLLAEKGATVKSVLDKLGTGGDPTALKDLMAKLEKAEKEFKEADTLAKKYETDLTAAKKDLDDAKKVADDAKKVADDTKKLLEDKTKEYDTAAGKLKSAEENIAAVVKELKDNKLIPEDTDPAKVPGLMKDIAATAASADAKKAAEAILKANKQIEMVKAEIKKAEQEVVDAKKAAKDAAEDAEKKVAAAKVEAEKFVAAKLVESVKAEEALKAKVKAEQVARDADLEKHRRDLAAEAEKFKKQLAAREDQFAVLIAQARAGGPVPLTAAEKAAKERAGRIFGTGVVAYEAGNWEEAETAFLSATKEDPNDARYFYFLGLARFAKGSTAPADEAFKKGAELETRSLPPSSAVSASLERVQGPVRRVLAAHRP